MANRWKINIYLVCTNLILCSRPPTETEQKRWIWTWLFWTPYQTASVSYSKRENSTALVSSHTLGKSKSKDFKWNFHLINQKNVLTLPLNFTSYTYHIYFFEICISQAFFGRSLIVQKFFKKHKVSVKSTTPPLRENRAKKAWNLSFKQFLSQERDKEKGSRLHLSQFNWMPIKTGLFHI